MSYYNAVLNNVTMKSFTTIIKISLDRKLIQRIKKNETGVCLQNK